MVSMYRPIRLYSTAALRKTLIKNYKNKVWEKSAEKYAFMRFQKLAKAVEACNEEIQNVADEGSDEAWERALQTFNKNMSNESDKTPLTKILEEI